MDQALQPKKATKRVVSTTTKVNSLDHIGRFSNPMRSSGVLPPPQKTRKKVNNVPELPLERTEKSVSSTNASAQETKLGEKSDTVQEQIGGEDQVGEKQGQVESKQVSFVPPPQAILGYFDSGIAGRKEYQPHEILPTISESAALPYTNISIGGIPYWDMEPDFVTKLHSHTIGGHVEVRVNDVVRVAELTEIATFTSYLGVVLEVRGDVIRVASPHRILFEENGETSMANFFNQEMAITDVEGVYRIPTEIKSDLGALEVSIIREGMRLHDDMDEGDVWFFEQALTMAGFSLENNPYSHLMK